MESDWKSQLDKAVDALFPRMVEVRRHLHRHPEISGKEQKTSLYLYQLLGDDGFDIRIGPDGRGVVADLRTNRAAPLIGLRADIDALHIHEATGVEYRSQVPGVMHACGHDAHTATVYGALNAIAALRNSSQPPCDLNVRAIFQPAEESCQGAAEMIAFGALEEVAAILATHMDPSRALGKVGLRAGVFTANCDEMSIVITGRGGHAARPHEAHDPIAAAAQIINALYLYIPRVTDSQEAVVVTIGQIQGGDTANVIPEQVQLKGTIRTLDHKVRDTTMEHIRRIARSVGETCGTRIEVAFGLGCRSVRNDVELINLLRNTTTEILGAGAAEEIARPSMGSEDFAFYLDTVPGAMVRLGCTSAKAGGAMLHSPHFDIDEEVMRVGAKILARALVYWSLPS